MLNRRLNVGGFKMSHVRIGWLILWALIAQFGVPVRAQESSDEAVQYFDGLRERRLFSLAETVCLRKLE